ncbi:hypothetical protein ElyMa_003662000 [Elysia marginata]|uniref:Uncharacterized protein n=1 Tax=Elysia marginata TaxID=1093978 RepID=A0AAV4EWV9_9GAST|nr:hypothetical protein ElyMa_003662000 [Elysia marginata]
MRIRLDIRLLKGQRSRWGRKDITLWKLFGQQIDHSLSRCDRWTICVVDGPAAVANQSVDGAVCVDVVVATYAQITQMSDR